MRILETAEAVVLPSLVSDYLDTLLQALPAEVEVESSVVENLVVENLVVESSVITSPVETALELAMASVLEAVDVKASIVQEETVSNACETFTSPEQELAEFTCLRFIAGRFELLTPIDRIQRVAYASNAEKKFCLLVPECEEESRSQVLHIRMGNFRIAVKRVLELVRVKQADVLWRPVRTLSLIHI